MSSGMTFLLWLAWVAGCTGVVVLLLTLSSNFYRKRMLALVRTLRCPDCGGVYDETTLVPFTHSPSAINVSPGDGPPPRPPPPGWQVTCSACRAVAVYTEHGELQRMHRPTPSLGEAA